MPWNRLHKPIMALAPLDDVTDVVFRQIVVEAGKPDVFFTEFTNCDALCSPGREMHGKRLLYTEEQRPIIAQIWGSKPENFYEAAKLLVEKGFDGIDINMGCPDKKVLKAGLCAGLIENHALAKEIIEAVKEGASHLPISVKTRLGIRKPVVEEWIGFLLEQNLDAIIIHGRTVKEVSNVPANWEEIAKGVRLRDESKKETLIIGNGDVFSRTQALDYVDRYGVDGVMIGRGIFKDLWLFHPEKSAKDMSVQERLAMFLRHIDLWKETWADTKNFPIIKKFVKIYVHDFDGAAELRNEVMGSESLEEMEEVMKKWISSS